MDGLDPMCVSDSVPEHDLPRHFLACKVSEAPAAPFSPQGHESICGLYKLARIE